MGEASRRKKAKRRGLVAVPPAATSLASLVRELREALVAETRGFVEGEPVAAAAERVDTAAGAIRALLELDNGESSDIDIVGPDPDRLTMAFMADVAGLSAMRVEDRDHPDEAEIDLDVDIQELGLDTAERLIAFEGLSLGTRARELLDGGPTLTFAAAAICVLGATWDPLGPDPLDSEDLGVLVAAISAARATLLVIDAAEGADDRGVGDTVVAAAAALRALSTAERERLADGNSPVAWQVTRALAAAFGPDSLATVRTIGGQVPALFAAGAFGKGWFDGTEIADRFDRNVTLLEGAFAAIDPDELRGAVALDPLLAAYAAGLTAAGSAGATWAAPWPEAAGGEPEVAGGR